MSADTCTRGVWQREQAEERYFDFHSPNHIHMLKLPALLDDLTAEH
jgi:hypothetical protein